MINSQSMLNGLDNWGEGVNEVDLWLIYLNHDEMKTDTDSVACLLVAAIDLGIYRLKHRFTQCRTCTRLAE